MFRKTTKIDLEVSPEEFYSRVLGQHFSVHHIDFEVYDKLNEDRIVKIFPHTENTSGSRVTFPPITHLQVKYKKKDNSPYVEAEYHMRSIDKGMPMFLMLFFTAILIAGIINLILVKGYGGTYLILGGIALVGYLILAYLLNFSYYDYTRKINHWVEAKCM